MCRSHLEIADVTVGAGRQDYMHTISAGDAAAPPMVLLPGYGAGAGFYFRNIDGIARHFRLHAVDLLGTGMSGERLQTFRFNPIHPLSGIMHSLPCHLHKPRRRQAPFAAARS
jgi:pimeloyl-ACP methyl ester carboxylesterase